MTNVIGLDVGTTGVRCLAVDENGKVYEATACSGHKLLRQAAVDAAYQTQITPTIISGKAVKVGGILLYEFKLEEGKSGLVNTKRAQVG